MKLSIFVLPALAFGATFGRHSNQQSDNDFLEAELQQISDMIDLEDGLAFDAIAEEELARSSRDLIGWNRNINHGFEREQRMKSVRPASKQLDFILSTGNYSVEDIIQAMNRIKARQNKIRRMQLIRNLGY